MKRVLQWLAVPYVLWTIWCGLMKAWPVPFALPLPRAIVRVGVLLLPVLWWSRKASGRDALHLRRHWRRGLLVGIATALLWFVPLCCYRLYAGGYVGRTPSSGAVWLNWILGSPFAEEVFFRALLLRELQSFASTVVAAFISALLFALFHLPLWIISGELQGGALIGSLGAVFGYGLVFAALFLFTRSPWGSFISHAANNLVAQSLVVATA
jgi:uncharacterized protein